MAAVFLVPTVILGHSYWTTANQVIESTIAERNDAAARGEETDLWTMRWPTSHTRNRSLKDTRQRHARTWTAVHKSVPS